jgi:adenylate kinase family enzyme
MREQLHSPSREQRLFVQKELTPAEIVNQLFDINYIHLMDKLGNEIERNSLLEYIVIMGTPGSGKTTITKGLEETLKNNGLDVETRYYDEFFYNFTKEQFNRTKKLYRSETEMDDSVKGEWIAYQIQHMLAKPAYTDPTKRHMVLLEIPAVGEQPLGQHVIEAIGLKIHETERIASTIHPTAPDVYEIDTMVIHVVADERVKEKAKRIRDRSITCKHDYQLKVRLRALGIDLGDPTFDDLHSTDLVQLYRKMANSKQIQSIQKQFDQQAKEYYKKAIHTDKLSITTLQHATWIPLREDLTQTQWQRITRNAQFAHHQLEDWLPRLNNYHVVINFFMPGTIRITHRT